MKKQPKRKVTNLANHPLRVQRIDGPSRARPRRPFAVASGGKVPRRATLDDGRGLG